METVNEIKEKLLRYEREILELLQKGDVDSSMKYLKEEAIVCPPGMEIVIGREQQRGMFKELLSMKGVELTWEPIDTFIGPSNDMAYVRGSVEWKLPNEPRQFGKYLSIWVKEENGEWKNMAEMRNSDK